MTRPPSFQRVRVSTVAFAGLMRLLAAIRAIRARAAVRFGERDGPLAFADGERGGRFRHFLHERARICFMRSGLVGADWHHVLALLLGVVASTRRNRSERRTYDQGNTNTPSGASLRARAGYAGWLHWRPLLRLIHGEATGTPRFRHWLVAKIWAASLRVADGLGGMCQA